MIWSANPLPSRSSARLCVRYATVDTTANTPKVVARTTVRRARRDQFLMPS